ncbi:hypothetical protein KEM54_002029 [Ascosphaera aggregata]|nr:hypothetical protein KEM54_002029 [Ascosphaera aggregata]
MLFIFSLESSGTKTRNPRSRPLSIAKAISRLAREDPVASTSFLEGVSLLAWDVAWLARTQGVRQGTESWEDICDIGHNLYRLFIAPPAQAPSSSASPKSSRNLADPPSSRLQPRTTNNHSALGRYSHGSAQFFLCSAEGTEFMGNWKYNGPGRFVEKVKGALISEIHSAEWELLDGQDWSRDNEGEVERERKDSQAEPGENLEQTPKEERK